MPDVGNITFSQQFSALNAESFNEYVQRAFSMKVASRIFNTPLIVTSDRLQTIISAFGDQVDLIFEGMQVDYENSDRDSVESESSKVAVIQIYDTLVYKTYGLMTLSGLTSYEKIREEFDAALADDKVEEIVFDIESPGGEVAGNFELVDHIYQSRGVKPITAIVNDYAYSGGYSIASAADKIYIPRTGGVGSIGVIAVHVDQSSYDEKLGVKYTAITSGKKKNSFSPHKPLSEDTLEEVQARVDESRKIFAETVARNRGISSKSVYDTEAGIYQGAKAVDIGLADEVSSWHEIMKTILAKYEGGKAMSGSSTNADQIADATAEKITEVQTVVVEDTDQIDELKSVVESLKGQVDGLNVELIDTKSRLEEAQKKLAEVGDEKRKLEIAADLADLYIIGSVSEAVDTLFSLEKANPDLYTKELDRMKQTSAALEGSGYFEEQGSSAEGNPSPFNEIMLKVKELTDQGISEREAHQQVMKANPSLYAKYRGMKQ